MASHLAAQDYLARLQASAASGIPFAGLPGTEGLVPGYPLLSTPHTQPHGMLVWNFCWEIFPTGHNGNCSVKVNHTLSCFIYLYSDFAKQHCVLNGDILIVAPQVKWSVHGTFYPCIDIRSYVWILKGSDDGMLQLLLLDFLTFVCCLVFWKERVSETETVSVLRWKGE
jgi:hypothetical protein